MLDLSSGLGQLPFFALAGRYYISEAPLCPILLFTFFTWSFFIVSMPYHQFGGFVRCLAFRFVLSFYNILFSASLLAVLHLFLPSWPSLHPLTVWYLTHHSPPSPPFSQAKRSQAVCPDPSVPVNVLAWRQWCAAVTSTSTHYPKASPET